jgi:phthalate 4,5-dioxygenase oxygenase subunit
MISAEDNTLLTQTGPGTPMGRMLREYWWPVMRADKLQPDGAPERVRLLGEDYVAWRDSEGRVGFLDEFCPHRRVSLALARNEDNGLRCIMHGWKIDVSGNVVEMPNEARPGARLGAIKVRHFPVRDAAKMIWAYVGPGEAPPFPAFPFIDAESIEVLVAKIDCNWVQVLETLWDPGHVQVLHAQGNTFKRAWEGTSFKVADRDDHAVFGCETRDEPYGFRYRFAQAASVEDGSWTPTVMPCWIFISGVSHDETSDRIVFGHTPIDDEHMLIFQIPFNLSRPFGDFGLVQSTVDSEDQKHDFRLPTTNRAMNWGQDREAMRNQGSFTGIGSGMKSGILGVINQDIAVAESMGPISNRTFENLGPADQAVVKGRRVLLKALRDYMATGTALGSRFPVSNIGRPGGDEYLMAAAE